jgi:outer membrane protein assembly factor BamB
MSVSEPRPAKSARLSNLAIWGLIVVLGLLFAALTVYQVLGRNRSAVNQDLLKELTDAVLVPPAVPPEAPDWPQWRGPSRDGVSTETGLLAEWPDNGPKKLWSQKTGAGYSGIVVARGRVFTMVQDGDDEAVVCWDAVTGDERWRFRYPAHFSNPYGDGPRSTPAIFGDHIYTVGGTGILHCLKAFTDDRAGEKVWRKDLAEEFGSRQLEWGTTFSPLVDRGYLFIMPGGDKGRSIACLNPADGKTLWSKLDDLPSYSSPIAADIDGQRHVVFLTGQRLVGVDPHTGNLLWELPWGPTATHAPTNITTPLIIHLNIGDYVFLSSGYDKGCALFKIAKDGDRFRPEQVYHNRNLRSTFATPVQHGFFLYGFDDVHFTCLDWRTGQQKWKESGYGKGSVTIADGKLIVLSDNGTLALAEANTEEYSEISGFEHGRQPSSWTVPVVSNGRLYVRDKSRIVCYELRNR